MATSLTYRHLTDAEHARISPDMYLGDINVITKNMHVFNLETMQLEKREVTYSRGILSIFDELLMNAIDNLHRKPPVKNIQVNISDDSISVYNDGYSIPIRKQEGEEIYIPEMLFTKFRSGSNFERGDEKITGGKNGIGCKVATVFSTETILKIVNTKKCYIQLIDNEIHSPEIYNTTECDSVEVTMKPNFKLFKIDSITDDTKMVLYRRIYDLSHLNVSFVINEKRLPNITWDTFVRSFNYITGEIYSYSSNRWFVSFGLSAKKQTESYVNNIHTSNNGNHVDFIRSQLVGHIQKVASKDLKLTSTQINNRIAVFIYATIVNPHFTSQGKERLSTPVADFRSLCVIPITKIKLFTNESNIVQLLTSKTIATTSKSQRKRFVNVDGAIDANWAHKRNGLCTLFVCEGISARAMCVNGMSVLNQPNLYGCFPLGGKVLNVRGASTTKYMKNKVLTGLKTLIGLVDGTEYTLSTLSTLRYGKVVCVKDADSDGASIMGLVINFFSKKFKSLLEIPGFFNEFITPMIKISIGKSIHEFYNEVDYRSFVERHGKRGVVSFIKGLGANSPNEAKDYFRRYNEHCIRMEFSDESWNKLTLAFEQGPVWTNQRKTWICGAGSEVILRREASKPIKCEEFIDTDLMNYSYDACVRSIPSVIDGLKPTPRKILYVLRKQGSSAFTFRKVFQLGGDVANEACYRHGDQSMNGTIIGMLNDYPGSNNIPLLNYKGQPGSRMENGEDAAQPRYLSCALSEISNLIFPKEDDCLFNHVEVDGVEAEYENYVPIIPFILCNGTLGIGTGWSTEIPSFNPLDIIKYVRCMITEVGVKLPHINSYYRGYTGKITEDSAKWYYGSKIKISGVTAHITEIPIGIAKLKLTKLLSEYVTSESTEFPIISFEQSGDANEINYTLKFSRTVTEDDIIKYLRLNKTISKNNMVLFDSKGVIRKFKSIEDIISEWFGVRLEYYFKRKLTQLSTLNNRISFLTNKARFIKCIIDKSLHIHNKAIAIVENKLTEMKFDKIDDNYNYLIDIPIRFLTKEKYEELLKQINSLIDERTTLEDTSEDVIWVHELNKLEQYLINNNYVI